MVTRLYSHPIYLEHLTPPGHPERPDRLRAIERALEDEKFAALDRAQAPEGDPATILYAHPKSFVDKIRRAIPEEGVRSVDADTSVSPKSWLAALTAIGAANAAVDDVFSGRSRQCFRRFPAARPPCRKNHRDGFLPVQQRGYCRSPCPEGAWRRARRHRRLGRPPRQRHAGYFLGRSLGAILLDAPDAALPRHGRTERNRCRQHRQRAAQPPDRQRAVS